MARSHDTFTTIHSEGALLPPDLLQRIVADSGSLDGLTPDSYHLPGQRLNEAISQTWNRLQGAWSSFKAARERLPEGDLGTSITRDRWLLPLFAALDYGRLETAHAVVIDGKSYSISHRWRNVPIHLLGCGVSLDHRTARVAGAARATPHGLLQVYLNRSDDTLWGFLSNGLRLRILRDNVSLTRQAYVDFDLEAMMEGEVYADFVLLYLLCHQSRVEGEKPSDFWLEKWMNAAQRQDIRALDQMQKSVKQAIEQLGAGFIDHPANHALREALQTGALSTQDYYRQLLRLVYRLLFLFAAEDRKLLHPDKDPNKVDELTRQRYHDYYSTRRLREMAGHIKGTRHHDLFDSLRLVTRLLSGEAGYSNEQRAMLGLPVLDGWLFREEAVSAVIGCEIANRDLLDAVRALAFTEDPSARMPRPVDYRNLGPEELGSVYERLLEQHPQIHIEARTFSLDTAAGHERKTTGSYYTPDSLVQALLDSALNPVIEEARRAANPEAALLDLKICDPACGSGHFLIAAARRIANALAAIQTGEEEPPPEALRHALREVIGHCIYGVDINPLAVELCKVNLWMESLEPGKPLSFLEHRILCGNSLLGTTPALLAQGIPNDAFNPIEDDDPQIAGMLKKQNRDERRARAGGGGIQMQLFDEKAAVLTARITEVFHELDEIPDISLDGVQAKEGYYGQIMASDGYRQKKQFADSWCAAFVWLKTVNAIPAISDGIFWQLADGIHIPQRDAIIVEINRLAEQYQFFHWHVAFPDVFHVPEHIEDAENAQTGWNGGFDCVLGNPPWDMIQLDDREFFAVSAPEIAQAETMAIRKQSVDELQLTNPHLHQLYLEATRHLDGIKHLVHSSGRYPYTSYGRLNSAPLFAELALNIQSGQAGQILPTGIATDSFNQYFFLHLMERYTVASLYSFENEEFIFPAVHHATKFCLLTLTSLGRQAAPTDFVFFARQVIDLKDTERHFQLSIEDLEVINPNTKTALLARSSRDARLAQQIYRRIPVFVTEDDASERNPWGFNGILMFMMNTDSHFFKQRSATIVLEEENPSQMTIGGKSYVVLYEGKMIYQFDHRFGTYEGQTTEQANQGKLPEFTEPQHQDPTLRVWSRYWVTEAEVNMRLREKWCANWMIAWRDITSAVTTRTVITAILPRVGAGNKAPILAVSEDNLHSVPCLVANLNSFVFDYTCRQKIGGTSLNFYILKQLPTLPPYSYSKSIEDYIISRVLELTYTAWDLQPFAQDVGYDGPPFIWDEDRRFLMRCELDALYFHLYQIVREDVDYIMETFPIVKRKDEKAYGEYRTKRIILQMYDQMAALPKVSVPHPKGIDEEYLVPDVSGFQTWLTPPPADRSVAHPEKQ